MYASPRQKRVSVEVGEVVEAVEVGEVVEAVEVGEVGEAVEVGEVIEAVASVEAKRRTAQRRKRQTMNGGVGIGGNANAGRESERRSGDVSKFKGRPLFENLHKKAQTSLLSHKSLEIDMKGFFNLLVIIIFTINFRLVLENFKKYGQIIRMPNRCDIDRNLPLFICFLCLNISVIFSWFIERYVACWLYHCVDEKNKSSTVFATDQGKLNSFVSIKKINCSRASDEITNDGSVNSNGKNCGVRMRYMGKLEEESYDDLTSGTCPFRDNSDDHFQGSTKENVISHSPDMGTSSIEASTGSVLSHYDAEPVLSTMLLTLSIVWFFKMYSFHQVCYDTRKLYIDGINLDRVSLDKTDTGRENDLSLDIQYIKTYPYCLNLKSYYTYILMPTMCFQYTYPRTEKIRWVLIFKHILEVIFLLIMIKIISDQYIFTTIENTFTMKEFKSAKFGVKITHLIERMLKVSIPTLYIWLIGFLIVFHHWCNILAEITKFGDRLFYKDWWNANSFAEYWRKWNLPIHYFVYRHINKPLIYYGVNKTISMIIVFFISALLHEYLISIPLKLGFSGYIFFFFIGQIPLIHLTNNVYFKKHKTIGNSIFWIVFCVTGQPLILFIYYYSWIEKQGILKS
ncbi:diacylglycerol O-acyltransferase, putative (DGAT) [Plasmodium ovale wallikeri]|uniref:O-acyltransferase n=1 Tax=Plasmodium ovale wallikeri TaxID=864142 RepID=A0A1A8YRI5_PLAOA|nr:diacylglycerol O-acyltransferase, putative (DGAT) [Plasmodium ovale wallikeri]